MSFQVLHKDREAWSSKKNDVLMGHSLVETVARPTPTFSIFFEAGSQWDMGPWATPARAQSRANEQTSGPHRTLHWDT